jgi:large subunit ribosomal protein L17
MRKRIFGSRLKRDTNQRKLLFRSLMRSLVLVGKIKTTEAKAKAIKGEIEKLVTKAKKKNNGARQLLMSRLADDLVVDKIISEIAPKFVSRPGGYTRILKLGRRLKDAAPMVMLTWVEEVTATSFEEPKRSALNKSKSSPEKTKESKKTKTVKKETVVKKVKK